MAAGGNEGSAAATSSGPKDTVSSVSAGNAAADGGSQTGAALAGPLGNAALPTTQSGALS